MAQQFLGLGNIANDGLGDKLRTGGQKIAADFAELYLGANVWDSTVIASQYVGATNELKITAAVADAVIKGKKYCWVSQSMLPYNASLVTFNTAVQMLREGGAARWLDLQAYGADGSGSGTLCDASWTAMIARGVYLSSRNLGASMPSTGVTIYAPQGTYYVSATLDFTTIPICEVIGDGPRLTRIITSVTSTAGINACNFATTSFTVLRGFTLYQSGLVLPGSQTAGNYGIRNTTGVGFQLLIDEVEVNYFANSAIFIEGATGPTIISNCSIQSNAGWGVELAKNAGNPGENIQMLSGNIHLCWGGIKVDGADGCQFHAVDIENGSVAKWPCIYLTGAAYGNSFYECTISAQPVAPLVNPSNGIVVVDDGSANTFINGINIAGNGQGTDNYRFTGAADKTTVIGGLHNNTLVGGGFFAVIQALNSTFINNTLATGTYGAGKNLISEGSGSNNFTVLIGGGGTGPLSTAGLDLSNSGVKTGKRLIGGGVLALTYGVAVAMDCSNANSFRVVATDGVAFTITPSNVSTTGSQFISLTIQNGSGGALGAITFAAPFKMGTFTAPANGQQRTILLWTDGVSLREIAQSAVDVPN